MDKGQTMRWSKGELEDIRSYFSGEHGEELIYNIRATLLGFASTKLVPALSAIIQKLVVPNLTPDVPLGQQADLYFSLGSIKEIHPEVGFLHIQARDKAVEYLLQRLEVLKGNTVLESIKLEELKNGYNKINEDRVVDMLAYLFLTNNYIDSCMIQLKTLANQKELTEEEQQLRAKKDSSK